MLEPKLESSVFTLVVMMLVSDELPENSLKLNFWNTVLGAVSPLIREFSEKTISETLDDECSLVVSVLPWPSSHVVKIASCVVEFPSLFDWSQFSRSMEPSHVIKSSLSKELGLDFKPRLF